MYFRTGSQYKSAGIVSVCRAGKRQAILSINLDPLIDDLAKFSIDVRFVVPVAAIADPARNGADIALVPL
jgi:hypothetical protein